MHNDRYGRGRHHDRRLRSAKIGFDRAEHVGVITLSVNIRKTATTWRIVSVGTPVIVVHNRQEQFA